MLPDVNSFNTFVTAVTVGEEGEGRREDLIFDVITIGRGDLSNVDNQGVRVDIIRVFKEGFIIDLTLNNSININQSILLIYILSFNSIYGVIYI